MFQTKSYSIYRKYNSEVTRYKINIPERRVFVWCRHCPLRISTVVKGTPWRRTEFSDCRLTPYELAKNEPAIITITYEFLTGQLAWPSCRTVGELTSAFHRNMREIVPLFSTDYGESSTKALPTVSNVESESGANCILTASTVAPKDHREGTWTNSSKPHTNW